MNEEFSIKNKPLMNSFKENLMETNDKNSMFDGQHMFLSDLYASKEEKVFQLKDQDM